jgi:peptidoglycan LD-endopeptidase CwlK
MTATHYPPHETRDPLWLVPLMQTKIQTMLTLTANQGVSVLIYCTYRSINRQNELFVQSRTPEEVAHKIAALEAQGFTFLADSLRITELPNVMQRHVTNAAGGESVHQYGQAADCVPLDKNGHAIWTPTGSGEWGVFLRAARTVGLICGTDWETFRDFPHVQLVEASNALDQFISAAEAGRALDFAAGREWLV